MRIVHHLILGEIQEKVHVCRFWLALSHYIKAQECTALEPAVRELLSLSKKVTIIQY